MICADLRRRPALELVELLLELGLEAVPLLPEAPRRLLDLRSRGSNSARVENRLPHVAKLVNVESSAR